MFIKNSTLIKLTIMVCVSILVVFIFCPAHAETYDCSARIVYMDAEYAEIEFEDGNVFGFMCDKGSMIRGDRVIAHMDDNDTSSILDDKVLSVRPDLRGVLWILVILVLLSGFGVWDYYQTLKR